MSKNMWLSNMRQVVAMKASRVMECVTEEESSTIKMEDTMRGIGETIRWMDLVSSTTKEASWPIKATGRKMSSMVKARSTTTIPSTSLAHSTTPTSTCLRTTGNTTRACWFTTPRRDAVESSYPTARCSRGTSTTTESKVLVNSTLSKAKQSRVFGESRS